MLFVDYSNFILLSFSSIFETDVKSSSLNPFFIAFNSLRKLEMSEDMPNPSISSNSFENNYKDELIKMNIFINYHNKLLIK